MGCSCLLPGSLEPILPDFRQMSGGGLCTYTNIKSKIKANETTLDAIQAHDRIVKKQAKPVKLPHEPKPKVRSLYKHEARELSEIKVKSTEKSRERTKESLEEGPVLFVRTCKKRKTGVSSRTGYGYEENQQRAAIALQMFRGITGQPLDKDSIATAVSGTFALPFLLTERVARPSGAEEMMQQMQQSIQERLRTEEPMNLLLEGISYDEVAGWEDAPHADPVFDIGQNFSETDFAALDLAAAQAAANTFI